MARPVRVLFLCTGNSARSILAEALLNHLGRGWFVAYSAGSHPKGEVHPLALDVLARHGVPVDSARSKSWEEFAAPGAPEIDFIVTVCDNAAQEACPVWPGRPASAHWGIPDPASVFGTLDERRRAFDRAFQSLDPAIRRLVQLELFGMDRSEIAARLADIGPSRGEAP